MAPPLKFSKAASPANKVAVSRMHGNQAASKTTAKDITGSLDSTSTKEGVEGSCLFPDSETSQEGQVAKLTKSAQAENASDKVEESASPSGSPTNFLPKWHSKRTSADNDHCAQRRECAWESGNQQVDEPNPEALAEKASSKNGALNRDRLRASGRATLFALARAPGSPDEQPSNSTTRSLQRPGPLIPGSVPQAEVTPDSSQDAQEALNPAVMKHAPLVPPRALRMQGFMPAAFAPYYQDSSAGHSQEPQPRNLHIPLKVSSPAQSQSVLSPPPGVWTKMQKCHQRSTSFPNTPVESSNGAAPTDFPGPQMPSASLSTTAVMQPLDSTTQDCHPSALAYATDSSPSKTTVGRPSATDWLSKEATDTSVAPAKINLDRSVASPCFDEHAFVSSYKPEQEIHQRLASGQYSEVRGPAKIDFRSLATYGTIRPPPRKSGVEGMVGEASA